MVEKLIRNSMNDLINEHLNFLNFRDLKRLMSGCFMEEKLNSGQRTISNQVSGGSRGEQLRPQTATAFLEVAPI